MPDAVVIGAGPNGLVAANVLADHGWDVVVLEAERQPGGAVRTDELTAPGFHNDVFSAFYPLAAASPVIRSLDLGRYGLEWRHAPAVLAHPLADGRCALISRDIAETARSLDALAPGDGAAWERMYAQWDRIREPFLDALLSPFPPLVAGGRLAAHLGVAGGLRFARQMVLPVRRFGEEEFTGEGARLLLAGNALHADLSPESAGSGAFGWLLCCLAQDVGFPVPAGGAERLIDALVARLRDRGGVVECATPVTSIVVRSGRAVAVRTADGREVPATRAVLADVDAPTMYLELVGAEHLPPRVVGDLRRFQFDSATVKVDWAVSAPVPWTAEQARGAGTVHLGDTVNGLSRYFTDLATGQLPAEPYLVVGQMTTADPSRSPAGTESLWAYTHVPQEVTGDSGGDLTGKWNESEANAFADRMEAVIERYAPGFRDLIAARHIQTPPTMEAADANLVGGAINGGTAQLHQQLIFRPIPGLARPETPIGRLFLASASAHPGGGVHGAPGANAARAAVLHHRTRRMVRAAAGAALPVGAGTVRALRRRGGR